jgi:GMP synthase PP-ATPase subunit
MYISTTIYIGLDDQDAKKQVIKTTDARARIVNSLFFYGFQFATISDARGVYKYQNGATAYEKTIKIEIIQTARESIKTRHNVDALRESLKKQLNQETIAIKKTLCFFNCR